MLKNLSIVLLAISMLFVMSCASKKDATKDIAAETQIIGDVPNFFLMPPTADKVFYGVGSAKMSSLDLSRTMALSRARDDIARQVDLQVKNAITDYAQEAGVDSVQTIKFTETVSRQIADTKLQGAKPIEMYAAKDGTIYALVEYDTTNLTRDAATVFIRNEESAFSEFKAAQALEKLNFELKNNPTKSQPVTD